MYLVRRALSEKPVIELQGKPCRVEARRRSQRQSVYEPVRSVRQLSQPAFLVTLARASLMSFSSVIAYLR